VFEEASTSGEELLTRCVTAGHSSDH